jgi:hypothetical protein
MTDQELLEAAAKAAGIDGDYRTEYLCIDGDWENVTAIFLPDDDGWWNPLTDDGDAFRLAVDLGLLFAPLTVLDSADPDEAARRAIVTAAAQQLSGFSG